MLPCPAEESDHSAVARHQVYLRVRSVQVASSYPITSTYPICWRRLSSLNSDVPVKRETSALRLQARVLFAGGHRGEVGVII